MLDLRFNVPVVPGVSAELRSQAVRDAMMADDCRNNREARIAERREVTRQLDEEQTREVPDIALISDLALRSEVLLQGIIADSGMISFQDYVKAERAALNEQFEGLTLD